MGSGHVSELSRAPFNFQGNNTDDPRWQNNKNQHFSHRQVSLFSYAWCFGNTEPRYDKQWYTPSCVNDDLSRIWVIRVLSTGFSNLPLQVLSSVSFHPSGHSLRHSPVTEFLTYRHTLQFVARGVMLEVLRHPKLLVINKYLFSSFVKT